MIKDIVKSGNRDEILAALRSAETIDQAELFAALETSILRRDHSLVEVMLRFGADPNYIPIDAWPALHTAVECRQHEIIKVLVGHGANVNIRDQSGSTPLHVAVDLESDSAWQSEETPKTDLTSLLLELGADPRIENNAGKTALDVANEYGNEVVRSLLM